MADVATVLATCDAEYEGIRGAILDRQELFYAEQERAWQGLRTHQAKLPADGAQAVPDVGNATPDDETAPWPIDLLSLIRRQAVTVHKYVAEAGPGYLIQREVMVNGARYLAVEDVGGYLGGHDWLLTPEFAVAS